MFWPLLATITMRSQHGKQSDLHTLSFDHNVAYLLKEGTVDPERQLMLSNGYNTQHCSSCYKRCFLCSQRCGDRLCGLVVRVPGYRSRGQRSIRRLQIFWQVVGLERGPLSLVSTIEELLERKSSGSGLENREYGRRDPSRWPSQTLYSQKSWH
jgi:hypothetical protein